MQQVSDRVKQVSDHVKQVSDRGKGGGVGAGDLSHMLAGGLDLLAVASNTVGVTKLGMGRTVESLGEYLHEQRRSAQMSLRQLSEVAGVSNPYLSQIERGLRRPSAEVLQQLARALRISAETLYVRAGILNPDESGQRSVHLAILADPALSERQKNVLLDIYESFRGGEHAATDRIVTPATADI